MHAPGLSGRAAHPAVRGRNQLFTAITESGLAFFFNERKLHDIVVAAVMDHWPAVLGYQEAVRSMIGRLVEDGRAAHEFESETPLADATAAIFATLAPFMHPILLEQADPQELRLLARQVADLVLRSLAK